MNSFRRNSAPSLMQTPWGQLWLNRFSQAFTTNLMLDMVVKKMKQRHNYDQECLHFSRVRCRKDIQLPWESIFSVFCKAFCVVLRQQTFREETQEKHIIIKKKILGTLVRSSRIYHTSPCQFFFVGTKSSNSHSTLLIISNNVCHKCFSNFIWNYTCRFFSERGTFLQLPIN